MRTVAETFDWHIQEKGENKIWNIKWYDFYINEEEVRKMLPYQKINHFPGSNWYLTYFLLKNLNKTFTLKI